MRAAGKILRELRLASNTVMREIGGALDEPPAHLMQQRTTPPEHPTATPEPPAEPPDSPAKT
jgi:hypothetical protein